MLIIRWFFNALTIILVAYLVVGIRVANFWSALVTALIMGIVNAVIRPIILFFALPINILTLGFFTLIVNAFMFWFVSTIVKGFYVDNFKAAFIGALIFWLVSWITNYFLKKKK